MSNNINLSLSYFNNVKTMRLRVKLGNGSDVLPLYLWCWVGEHQPETGLLKLNEDEIESVCHWWGERGLCVKTMVEIGFIRKTFEGFEVKDWLEYNGHLKTYKEKGKAMAIARWGNRSDAISNATSNATSIEQAMLQAMHKQNKTKQSKTKEVKDLTALSKQSKRFIVPTPSEVTEYAKTIEFNLDGEKFCNYYEARDWKLGNTRMKSWKAAVRLWKSNQNGGLQNARTSSNVRLQQTDPDRTKAYST